jgi:DNA topoisomerase-3
MQLVIAEKPSVARDLARVLGVGASGRHSFTSDDRVITWCVGHLVELEEPAAYDPRWKSWRLGDLPMIPGAFRLAPVAGTREQLTAVSRLLRARSFREVVNACDAGREGELIFRYVYELAGCRLPVRRLWISSLTDESIRHGFSALRPGSELDPLADAARCRSEADWLVGLNATRAVTLTHRRAEQNPASTGDGGLPDDRSPRTGRGPRLPGGTGRSRTGAPVFSIGRVQTPTLAILVKRERAIRDFRPVRYWEIRGKFTAPTERTFDATWGVLSADDKGPASRLGGQPLADQLIARLGSATSPGGSTPEPVVERVRQKKTREPAPQLFDLTSLQRTANRRYGMSATRTLEVAQALYERHKLLTYPRTDARHLTGDLFAELPRLFGALASIPTYAPFARPLLDVPPGRSRRVFDDGKVQDHHAIIPTGKTAALGALDRDEGHIFDLVVRRFLGVFHPDAEFALTDVIIRVGPPDARKTAALERDEPSPIHADTILTQLPPPPDRFFVRGRVRLVAGWLEVAGLGGGPPAGPGTRRPSLRRGVVDGDGAPDSAPDGAPGIEADATGDLPPLHEGDRLRGTFEALAKATKPPPHHTEATLLGAMESAGREIDDEALRAAMKDTGLGTPATRASTIETLIKRDFAVREGKQLRATLTGVALIETLPVPSLASPELTGTWEARLARIARGQEARPVFMRDIAAYVTEMVDAVRGQVPGRSPTMAPATTKLATRITKPTKHMEHTEHAGPTGRAKAGEEVPVASTAGPLGAPELPCPRCTVGRIVTGKRGWGCSRWRAGCGFVIWFETEGRHLTVTDLRALVGSGRTSVGVHLRAGVRVSGQVLLDLAAPQASGAARFAAVPAPD